MTHGWVCGLLIPGSHWTENFLGVSWKTSSSVNGSPSFLSVSPERHIAQTHKEPQRYHWHCWQRRLITTRAPHFQCVSKRLFTVTFYLFISETLAKHVEFWAFRAQKTYDSRTFWERIEKMDLTADHPVFPTTDTLVWRYSYILTHYRVSQKSSPPHRRRRRGQGGHVPPKIREEYFSGNYYLKFGYFVGKNNVKFGNFVNFSGKKHYKNSGILLIVGQESCKIRAFCYYFFHTHFSGKNGVPPKVDWGVPTPMV